MRPERNTTLLRVAMENCQFPTSRSETVASMSIVDQAVSVLKPYLTNARTHSKRQIRQIAESIRVFGFTNPVLVDRSNRIIAGHGRVQAASLLGMNRVPT